MIAEVRREVYRLHAWLVGRGLTAIITGRSLHGIRTAEGLVLLDFMQFMVDCAGGARPPRGRGRRPSATCASRSTAARRSRRTSTPFVIGQTASSRPSRALTAAALPATNERVSQRRRAPRHDAGRRLFPRQQHPDHRFRAPRRRRCAGHSPRPPACAASGRCSSASIRGGGQIVRNLASVGIRLAPHVKAGLLRDVVGAHHHRQRRRASASRRSLREHKAALHGDRPALRAREVRHHGRRAHGVAERVIEWSRMAASRLFITACSTRCRRSAGRIDGAADLDDRRHLDPPDLPGAWRRAQPRPRHHEVARHGALQPGPRAGAEQQPASR